jgi:hypothetical protein
LRIGAGTGAAIDTYGFDLAHVCHVALQRKARQDRLVIEQSNRSVNAGKRERITSKRVFGAAKRSI